MTPPTPAAVRGTMKSGGDCTSEEEHALQNDKRFYEDILRDHIRAIAAEMREKAARANYANDLNSFADKLEGKQNENT